MANYLKRIPQVPKGGEPIAFDSGQRDAMEASYGRQLSEKIWTKIIVATGLYLQAAPSERAAVPIKTFLLKLEQLKVLAKSIKSDLAEDNGSNRNRAKMGDKRLAEIRKQYFQRKDWSDFSGRAPYEILEHTLDALVSVCESASIELSDPEYAGHREGWLWNNWICWLTMIVKEHGLPFEARNDSDKQTPDSSISPFVLFVDELQKCIPKEFRRHVPGDSERPGSLAKAIGRAREGMDVDCKFSDAIDIPGINELLE